MDVLPGLEQEASRLPEISDALERGINVERTPHYRSFQERAGTLNFVDRDMLAVSAEIVFY
jgi:hypothetical protein